MSDQSSTPKSEFRALLLHEIDKGGTPEEIVTRIMSAVCRVRDEWTERDATSLADFPDVTVIRSRAIWVEIMRESVTQVIPGPNRRIE